MKLMLVPALLVAALTGPTAPVQFEKNGIRVGSELVTGSAVSLKDLGAAPLLVSGSVVESLSGDALTVALDEKSVVLGAGLRLARTADGYRITTHGMQFTVEASGTSLAADRSAEFKVTEKGFDFGALGILSGTSFAARVTAATAPMVAADPVQDGKTEISPERHESIKKKVVIRRLYTTDPLAPATGANSINVRLIPRATPDGAP